MYWNINKTLSYNALFNFIVGARGTGKTYGSKKFVISDFLKSKGQFVYVRRYKEELRKRHLFFDDIKGEFPNTSFSVSGMTFNINDEPAGMAIPLSTAKIEKSTPFPNVNTIIFDEFILDKGFHHYLPDEVTNFLELYSTVARLRDVRVLFLSNALTMTNPYFLYFGINLPYGKNVQVKNDILIEMVSSEEYTETAKKTRFGQIIKDTPYGQYAIENQFLRDDNNFIQKKTKTARHIFIMIYKGTKYGVWQDFTQGLFFISEDYDPNCKISYSITMEDHTPNTFLLKGSKKGLFATFINAYKLGCVRFETMNTKNLMYDVIKLSL